MEPTDEIRQLEHELELKKAYLDVRVSFGKGNKYSQEVKDVVTKFVRGACLQEASGNSVQNPAFTPQEVALLKQMAQRLEDKAKQPVTTTQPENGSGGAQQTAPNKMTQMMREGLNNIKAQHQKATAQIVMLDNIDRTIRSKVEPEAVVQVITKAADFAFVETPQGLRFNIPLEDLDFNYERGE